MKTRSDFVTNSSSSSFIIARSEELTEKQKDAILDFVTKNFLTGYEKFEDGAPHSRDFSHELGAPKKIFKIPGKTVISFLHKAII